MGGVLDKTVKAVEEGGGVVVCFENCTGIKAAAPRVDTAADDIVRAVAARYLQIGCSVMTPNSRRMEMLTDLVNEYQVDGVIEMDLQACTPYAVESHSVRKLIGDSGIPYMVLETDYGKADSGQISTRIEAFLEML
jgi:benzoyl-CoA reductase/2-hydroxyglutaryl-CoA dehydratase subunit BcrC/BadD/HgdB